MTKINVVPKKFRYDTLKWLEADNEKFASVSSLMYGKRKKKMLLKLSIQDF